MGDASGVLTGGGGLSFTALGNGATAAVRATVLDGGEGSGERRPTAKAIATTATMLAPPRRMTGFLRGARTSVAAPRSGLSFDVSSAATIWTTSCGRSPASL